LFAKQIPSLKMLTAFSIQQSLIASFISYPGANDCLKNISVLHCSSNIYSEFFCHLSQLCYNIQSIYIIFKDIHISDGLADLISIQKNLRCFSIILEYYVAKPALFMLKLPDTLTKLNLCVEDCASVSFIAKLTNLQELELEFTHDEDFEDF